MMKILTRFIWSLFLCFSLPLAAQANKLLSIRSEPSGAKVMMGTHVIGTTPILSELEDFWFEGPVNKDSNFLSEPVSMTVSKEGFEPKTVLITKGPFEWVSPDKSEKKIYYIVESTDFNIKLEPAKNPLGANSPPQKVFVPPFTPQPKDSTWYKIAPEEINQKAKLKLERALSVKAAETNTETLFAKNGVIAGPLLWAALEGHAGNELKEAVTLNFVIQMPKRMEREGRSFHKPEPKRAFWNLFIEKIKGGNFALVRRATRPEIDYFWSAISFNIEEPLYVADIGERKVLFNFLVEDGEPRIFWMDIVGDLTAAK